MDSEPRLVGSDIAEDALRLLQGLQLLDLLSMPVERAISRVTLLRTTDETVLFPPPPAFQSPSWAPCWQSSTETSWQRSVILPRNTKQNRAG